MSKDIGLMFDSQLIRAFLEHRKTMTRRCNGLDKINETPDDWGALFYQGEVWLFSSRFGMAMKQVRVKCPFAVGDTIYAKEPYMLDKEYDHLKTSEIPDIGRKVANWYYTDGNHYADKVAEGAGRVRSAMFMPKWAARIWREITGIGCQRIQSITDEDAVAEGVGVGVPPDFVWIKGRARQKFRSLWEILNGKKHPWESNHYCWVLSLKER